MDKVGWILLQVPPGPKHPFQFVMGKNWLLMCVCVCGRKKIFTSLFSSCFWFYLTLKENDVVLLGVCAGMHKSPKSIIIVQFVVSFFHDLVFSHSK